MRIFHAGGARRKGTWFGCTTALLHTIVQNQNAVQRRKGTLVDAQAVRVRPLIRLARTRFRMSEVRNSGLDYVRRLVAQCPEP